MNTFVVDANVAVKWVLSEIHSEIAQCLLDDAHELLVPDFFFRKLVTFYGSGYDEEKPP